MITGHEGMSEAVRSFFNNDDYSSPAEKVAPVTALAVTNPDDSAIEVSENEVLEEVA